MHLNTQIITYLLILVEHVRNRQRLLTEDEVAYLFDVDIQTIRRWRREGLIDHITFEGSIIRYRWEHIERRIENCERLGRKLKVA